MVLNELETQRQALKKMALWDWGLVKIACMFLGIMTAVLYIDIIFWFDWYWWFVIAIVLAIPVIFKAYRTEFSKEDLRKLDGNAGMTHTFRMAKENLPIWHWGIVKLVSFLFGIGIIAYLIRSANYIDILFWMDWYWWGVIALVCAAVPLYFAYMYAPKKQTNFSKFRAQYTRRPVKKMGKIKYGWSAEYYPSRAIAEQNFEQAQQPYETMEQGATVVGPPTYRRKKRKKVKKATKKKPIKRRIRRR